MKLTLECRKSPVRSYRECVILVLGCTDVEGVVVSRKRATFVREKPVTFRSPLAVALAMFILNTPGMLIELFPPLTPPSFQ